MSNIIWSSEAIRATDAVCFDVKANGGVVLGLYVGQGEVAADYRLTSLDARRLADALIRGADECERAHGGAL